MSCGNHHDTPCGEVLDAVSAYLDGEMTSHDRQRFAQHFDECSPCLQEAGIYQEVKILVHRCCGNEQVPDEVRAKVISRIRSISVTWTTESSGE